MSRRLRAALAVVTLAAVAVGGQAAAKPKAKKPAPTPAPRTYTVAKGDTLTRIATRTGVSVDALVKANGIKNANSVRIGTVLTLPGTRTYAPPATTNLRTKPATAKPPRKVPSSLPARLRQSPERLALWGHFDAAAKAHGVPVDLLKAVAWQESGWQNDKISSTNAVGIGQLMPDTVDFVNEVLLRRARLDPGKPEDNIAMSARFLRYLLDHTKGDVATAVASYYQGAASVRKRGPLPETTQYVKAVVAQRRLFI